MDVILKFTFSFFVLIFLAACSSIYHPKNDHVPEGYSEQKISSTEYRIVFETYSGDGWEELEGFLYFRAAEIGIENNYSYFSITEQSRETETKIFRKPEVVGSSTVGSMGNTNQANTLIPAHDFEFKVKRVSGHFHYSNDNVPESIAVSTILESVK